MARGKNNIDWAKAASVFVQLPSCPTCGCVAFKRIRSDENGDGSHTLRAVCKTCGSPLKIIREVLPQNGKDE